MGSQSAKCPDSSHRPSSNSRTLPRRHHLAIDGELFLPPDRLVQSEAAVGTLDVAQRVPSNSDPRTTPRTRLRLGANPQRAIASRTPYAADQEQHHDDGDWERGLERPSWNPRHPLQDVRRNQAGKEEGDNYAPDNSVSLIKVFAHHFHGARFYSLWSAAQCVRSRRLAPFTVGTDGKRSNHWSGIACVTGSCAGVPGHPSLEGIARHASPPRETQAVQLPAPVARANSPPAPRRLRS